MTGPEPVTDEENPKEQGRPMGFDAEKWLPRIGMLTDPDPFVWRRVNVRDGTIGLERAPRLGME